MGLAVRSGGCTCNVYLTTHVALHGGCLKKAWWFFDFIRYLLSNVMIDKHSIH